MCQAHSGLPRRAHITSRLEQRHVASAKLPPSSFSTGCENAWVRSSSTTRASGKRLCNPIEWRSGVGRKKWLRRMPNDRLIRSKLSPTQIDLRNPLRGGSQGTQPRIVVVAQVPHREFAILKTIRLNIPDNLEISVALLIAVGLLQECESSVIHQLGASDWSRNRPMPGFSIQPGLPRAQLFDESHGTLQVAQVL